MKREGAPADLAPVPRTRSAGAASAVAARVFASVIAPGASSDRADGGADTQLAPDAR